MTSSFPVSTTANVCPERCRPSCITALSSCVIGPALLLDPSAFRILRGCCSFSNGSLLSLMTFGCIVLQVAPESINALIAILRPPLSSMISTFGCSDISGSLLIYMSPELGFDLLELGSFGSPRPDAILLQEWVVKNPSYCRLLIRLCHVSLPWGIDMCIRRLALVPMLHGRIPSAVCIGCTCRSASHADCFE